MQMTFTRWMAAGCILVFGTVSAYAQEPVSHFSQFATVVSIFKGAQKAVSMQETLVSGAVQLNNMLGGTGKYLSPFLKLGDIATSNRYDLIRAKKLSLGGLADETRLSDYAEASGLLDKTMLFSSGLSYTDEQIRAITNNQNLAVSSLAVDGMAFAMGTKAISSQHGADAVDIETITSSVTGANNLQEIFQVLTASDRQVLSGALTLASSEATIAILAATQALQGVSVSPGSSADIAIGEKKESSGISGVLDSVTGGASTVLDTAKSVTDKAGSLTDQVSSRVQKGTDNLINTVKGGS